MTAPEARTLIGQFGLIHANGRKHYHALHGWIRGIEDMSVVFYDVTGEKFKFGLNKIVSFTSVLFKCKMYNLRKTNRQ